MPNVCIQNSFPFKVHGSWSFWMSARARRVWGFQGSGGGFTELKVSLHNLKWARMILRWGRFSKSTGVSVTEDLSKRTREARQEMRKLVESNEDKDDIGDHHCDDEMELEFLDMSEMTTTLAHPNIRRFMRHVKKVNPEKRCFLQYDKLYIDGKVFMFNESTGKVFQTEKMVTIMMMPRWRSKWSAAWSDRRPLPASGRTVGRGARGYPDENDDADYENAIIIKKKSSSGQRLEPPGWLERATQHSRWLMTSTWRCQLLLMLLLMLDHSY